MSMTEDNCPEAVTDLQSCVCSKNNYFASLSASISSDVSYSCGSTASSDQGSASLVFSAYCNQDAVVTFPTPTIPVSQFITDIPEMSYLAPCASSQVAYAVMGMTYELCPPDAANLATCVCQKNQNSLVVSQSINLQVGEACSSHTADIASAQAFFSAYCKLNAGTSSFPSASNPPGDSMFMSPLSGCPLTLTKAKANTPSELLHYRHATVQLACAVRQGRPVVGRVYCMFPGPEILLMTR